MNYISWIMDNWIAKDDLKEKMTSLGEIENAEKNSSAASNMKTNDFLRMLNNNIVKLNYSTTLYSKCLLILTFALVFLTAILCIFR